HPALAGQHAAYIEKTLYDFQNGTRSNDSNSMMRALVKRMTKEEIQAVSSYIQGLYSE
ncbi:MAG TPA: cytochrome c4, partial [Gammaproteobacteria bacterium]|nr:cytochrome c4 [Gammaproteobacteria bacterium]